MVVEVTNNGVKAAVNEAVGCIYGGDRESTSRILQLLEDVKVLYQLALEARRENSDARTELTERYKITFIESLSRPVIEQKKENLIRFPIDRFVPHFRILLANRCGEEVRELILRSIHSETFEGYRWTSQHKTVENVRVYYSIWAGIHFAEQFDFDEARKFKQLIIENEDPGYPKTYFRALVDLHIVLNTLRQTKDVALTMELFQKIDQQQVGMIYRNDMSFEIFIAELIVCGEKKRAKNLLSQIVMDWDFKENQTKKTVNFRFAFCVQRAHLMMMCKHLKQGELSEAKSCLKKLDKKWLPGTTYSSGLDQIIYSCVTMWIANGREDSAFVLLEKARMDRDFHKPSLVEGWLKTKEIPKIEELLENSNYLHRERLIEITRLCLKYRFYGTAVKAGEELKKRHHNWSYSGWLDATEWLVRGFLELYINEEYNLALEWIKRFEKCEEEDPNFQFKTDIHQELKNHDHMYPQFYCKLPDAISKLVEQERFTDAFELLSKYPSLIGIDRLAVGILAFGLNKEKLRNITSSAEHVFRKKREYTYY